MVGLAHLFNTLICLSSLSVAMSAYIPPQRRADNTTCCGYVVTNRGDSFFNYRHVVDFSTLTSMDKVRELGWEVSHGWQAGGANSLTGQKPIANEANVELIRGEGLRLKVPKQDKNAKTFSVAEATFPDTLLGGVLKFTVKLTSTPGTCMAMFTIHADNGLDKPLGWQDEQDIEILGSTMFARNEFSGEGIQMVNYEPSTGAKYYANQAFPTGIDPSADFHKYEIGWWPTTSISNPPRLTEYRFDGQTIQNRPLQFSYSNPSALLFNHWTNADGRWSGGPPPKEVYMTIKKVVAYYDKPAAMKTGTGILKGSCTKEQACRVTV